MWDATSHELLQRYRSGDDRAAFEIHDRYIERLRALARKRVARRLNRRLDAEDVVQSAYRSFFVRARRNEFVLQRAGDLWRLLAQITVHKLLKQLDCHSAKRRDVALEQEISDLTNRLSSREPSPADAAAFLEQLQLVTSKLSAVQRDVLKWTLHGETPASIAQKLNRSTRTVRRMMEATRRLMEAELLPTKEIVPPAMTHDSNNESLLSYSDYVLEAHIGTGGMGKVYRAVRKADGARVAIKALLKRRQHNKDAVLQFEREAHYVRRLHHRHIVSIHGLGRFPGGGYFLVMDLIDGLNLAQRLKSGPFTEQHSVRIALDIGAAINFAHQQGVLHCDLKPSNILVSHSGEIVVSDFGMARLIAPQHTDRFAIFGGTPAFMAPEQFDASFGEIGVRTDIYGLGGILYAMLTGRAPRTINKDKKVQNFLKLLSEPICEPHRINTNISRELSFICQECLLTDPNARIASFEQLMEMLRQVQVGACRGLAAK